MGLALESYSVCQGSEYRRCLILIRSLSMTQLTILSHYWVGEECWNEFKGFSGRKCIESKETTDSEDVGQSIEGKMISMVFVGACLEMTAWSRSVMVKNLLCAVIIFVSIIIFYSLVCLILWHNWITYCISMRCRSGNFEKEIKMNTNSPGNKISH